MYSFVYRPSSETWPTAHSRPASMPAHAACKQSEARRADACGRTVELDRGVVPRRDQPVGRAALARDVCARHHKAHVSPGCPPGQRLRGRSGPRSPAAAEAGSSACSWCFPDGNVALHKVWARASLIIAYPPTPQRRRKMRRPPPRKSRPAPPAPRAGAARRMEQRSWSGQRRSAVRGRDARGRARAGGGWRAQRSTMSPASFCIAGPSF